MRTVQSHYINKACRIVTADDVKGRHVAQREGAFRDRKQNQRWAAHVRDNCWEAISLQSDLAAAHLFYVVSHSQISRLQSGYE